MGRSEISSRMTRARSLSPPPKSSASYNDLRRDSGNRGSVLLVECTFG